MLDDNEVRSRDYDDQPQQHINTTNSAGATTVTETMMSPEDEILDPRLHGTTSGGEQQSSSPTIRKLKIISSLACFGIFVVFIGAIRSGNENKYNVNDVDSDGVIDVGDEKYKMNNDVDLPIPPSNLNIICSPESVITTEGREECGKVCEVSECCNFPSTLSMSCLDGNHETCLQYHVNCYTLNHPNPSTLIENSEANGGTTNTTTPTNNNVEVTANIPSEAPDNMDMVCGWGALVTDEGRIGCSEVCSRASCCFEDNDIMGSCATSMSDICSGYDVCLSLKSITHIHDDITDDVNDKCSPTHITTTAGILACDNVCAHARCCFNGKSDSCPTDDGVSITDWCKQYASCGAIYDDMDDDTLDDDYFDDDDYYDDEYYYDDDQMAEDYDDDVEFDDDDDDDDYFDDDDEYDDDDEFQDITPILDSSGIIDAAGATTAEGGGGGGTSEVIEQQEDDLMGLNIPPTNSNNNDGGI